jgi:hypothetical protein
MQFLKLDNQTIIELDDNSDIDTVKRKFNAIPFAYFYTFEVAKIGTIEVIDNTAKQYIEPLPFWISKLALRRTLRQYNLEAALDNFLASNVNFKNDYNDAQKLKSDDTLLVNALQDISNQTGLVVEQIKTILYDCREL